MIVIHNAVVPSVLRSLSIADWPDMNWPGWHAYQTDDSLKYASRYGIDELPHSARICLSCMAARMGEVDSNSFPDFSLHGAGLHEIPPSGYLNMHLDSDHHPVRNWRREYSAVLFVDQRWDEDWGGGFNLRGHDTVYPAFNTMIVFSTTDHSWHEVEEVTGPISRRTVSLFSWSDGASDMMRGQALFKRCTQ